MLSFLLLDLSTTTVKQHSSVGLATSNHSKSLWICSRKLAARLAKRWGESRQRLSDPGWPEVWVKSRTMSIKSCPKVGEAVFIRVFKKCPKICWTFGPKNGHHRLSGSGDIECKCTLNFKPFEIFSIFFLSHCRTRNWIFYPNVVVTKMFLLSVDWI